MPQNQSSLDLAGCWFVNSGIQEPGGGVARYFHSDTGRNARVSTEITGYAVSTLVYLYERNQDDGILDAAIRASEFLKDRAWDHKLKTFPFEHSDHGHQPDALAYFFDCGIIVRGLLSLWRITRAAGLLECARQAGRSMLRDFTVADAIHPILTLPGKQPLPYAPQWSRSPGCYQLKSALAWHELFEITGETEFRNGYSKSLRFALDAKDRFLPAETPEKTMDRLHAYCYFLEGLMPFAVDPECRDALREGLDRVSNYLREIAPMFERSDVYAQLLRARLYAASLAGLPLDEKLAAEEATRIGEFQCESGGQQMRGGFYFGRKGETMLPFINPVSSAFCLQAQDLWHRRNQDSLFDPRTLI